MGARGSVRFAAALRDKPMNLRHDAIQFEPVVVVFWNSEAGVRKHPISQEEIVIGEKPIIADAGRST